MSKEIDALKKVAGPYKKWALQARKQYIDIRFRQDPEIRNLYLRVVKKIAVELKKYPGKSYNKKRLETIERLLQKEINQFVEKYTDSMKEYISEAVSAGSTYSKLVTLDGFNKAGIDSTGIRALFASVNFQATEACWARTKKGIYLSDRIWQKGLSFKTNITDIIQESVVLGQDAAKTARMLEQYVKHGRRTLAQDYPNMMKRMGNRIPGDISYEALRLARTETTAAFGEGNIAAAQVSPSYLGMKWILSKSHPVKDICDELAAHDEGLGRGVYSPGNEPAYPAHPNCLCILIPVHECPDKFVTRLKKWKRDPRNDQQLEDWYNKIYRRIA